MAYLSCEQEKKKFLESYKIYHGRYGQYVKGTLGEILGFIPVEDFEKYYETPENAIIFAMSGTDGCHYCMVEIDDIINIYAVFPNLGEERSVYLVGHTIDEVLSYLLSIIGLFECVFDYDKNKFLQIVEEVKSEYTSKLESEEFQRDLSDLKRVYSIFSPSASEVYDCLKNMNPNAETLECTRKQ